ncbi:alpha/beta hydrolase [Actinoplanes sp. NBRC 103695]|uniref:alpha/beta hydrolase n=1 Tax=Actinoplanes sp. NBRC 103695 TaxID=3032202 RepID=UPI0024A5E557|nr:alpha/beta hydrolase [Actinoplanes sp. NBRC 103695]GLZ01980.1 hypothetical protein Acsp02_92310 [Actinoplanes sp. NBRC 103695]
MPVAEPTGELWRLVALSMPSAWPEANEDTVRELSANWRGQGGGFIEAGGFSLKEIEDRWVDDAGRAYHQRAFAHLGNTADAGNAMVELGRRADAYAGEVAAVKLVIADTVARNEPLYAQVEPGLRGEFVTGVAAEVSRLLREAASRVYEAGGAPLGRAEVPPPETTPANIRDWWQTLPTATQDALKAENPDAVRNLDGIPAEVRNELNREALGRELATQKAQLARIDPAALNTVDEYAEYQALAERVRGLESLAKLPQEDHFLLGLDATGDGTAIVALGNPDTAANVSTLVPGVGSGLATVGDDIGRAANLRDAAGRAAGDDTTFGQTSVIAWVGYDSPSFVGGVSAAPAEAAAPRLDRFEDGLRATHIGPDAHQTIIAHSYGTVVTGIAAHRFGLDVDDVVLVASPGVPVNDVTELRLDGVPPDQVGQHVYAITGEDDWIQGLIQYVGGDHGANPVDPDFGAVVLEDDSGDGDVHLGYFDAGTASVRRLGGIII